MLTTPEAICWLYAVGCIDGAFKERKINEEDHNLALLHLCNRTIPEPRLVRSWFKRPFAVLEKCGKACTIEEMQQYWRVTHRSMHEVTPVSIAVVESMKTSANAFLSILTCSNKNGSFRVIDVHGYTLQLGTQVYLHQNIIAEIKS